MVVRSRASGPAQRLPAGETRISGAANMQRSNYALTGHVASFERGPLQRLCRLCHRDWTIHQPIRLGATGLVSGSRSVWDGNWLEPNVTKSDGKDLLLPPHSAMA
jgi:hypothetical protein